MIGTGTFMFSPAEAENSVREALKMGYSLVDTANACVNERYYHRTDEPLAGFAAWRPAFGTK